MAAVLAAPVAAGTGGAPMVAGCRVFPPDNVWNARVDGLPVHPRSAEWVAAIGRGASLGVAHGVEVHGVEAPGAPAAGPPPIVIGEITRPATLVDVELSLAEGSDPGPFPLPGPASAGATSESARDLLLVDPARCTLYELYSARRSPGGWSAEAAAVFDLRSNSLRAAPPARRVGGLPVLPGVIRWEEVESGAILHALRFTARRLSAGFEWPSTGAGTELGDPGQPPTGQRFRLRGDLDLSGFSPRVRVVLEALQRYGMLLAGVGPPWSLSVAAGARWSEGELAELARLRGGDFEAVDVSTLRGAFGSGRAVAPAERPPVAVSRVAPYDCDPGDGVACIDDGRFEIRVTWRDARGGERRAVAAGAGSRDTRLFWFFDPLYWELMVKVIDGCAVNGSRWVFFAGTTDLGFSVSVTDSRTGERRVYRSLPGEPALAVTDNQAFACEAPAGS
jgi:hypothetical protein